MPFPHYSKATPPHRAMLDRERRDRHYLLNNGSYERVDAYGQFGAMQLATRLGYAWPIEDVKTPYTDELNRLIEAGELVEAANHRADFAYELRFEAACIERAKCMVGVEAGPSHAELAAKRQAEEAARQEAIDARTVEIAEELAEAEQAERMRRARAAATQELSR